jgi:hypothetical protein
MSFYELTRNVRHERWHSRAIGPPCWFWNFVVIHFFVYLLITLKFLTWFSRSSEKECDVLLTVSFLLPEPDATFLVPPGSAGLFPLLVALFLPGGG